MKKSFKLQMLPALLCVAFSGSAFAAGFQLQNQNGAGTGLAYAGQAANAEDASTVFFNPAGMSVLPAGQNISVAGTVIDRSVNFTNTGSTGAGALGAPLLAGTDNGGNGGGTSLIPAFYYTRKINDQWTVGLGVSPTYGSETEYSTTFIGRFSGYFSSIKQTNINPSASYKVDNKLSVGFGLNFAKNEVEFKQAAAVPGVVLATLQGSDEAVGWNAGFLYQIDDKSRLGVAYRSRINFHLSGTQVVPGAINASITADLTTPSNLSVAYSRKYGDKLEILTDYTRTGWSSIPQLAATGGSNPVVAYNFRDSYRVGVGAKYQYDGKWNLRAGLAFDKTPIPDEASRTMTVPDSDRTWLSFGARMKIDEKSSLDMGYARIFLKDTSTARFVSLGALGSQTIRGNFESKVNLFSAQYNVNF
jgi:long-chain fatty acid transport protein